MHKSSEALIVAKASLLAKQSSHGTVALDQVTVESLGKGCYVKGSFQTSHV